MSDDVLIAMITTWGTIFVALIALAGSWVQSRRTQRRQQKMADQLDAVADDAKASRHQVENTHQTNLRADVDRLIRVVELVADGLQDARTDIGRLHIDVRQIRAEMRSTDQENERTHQTLFERIAALTTKDK